MKWAPSSVIGSSSRAAPGGSCRLGGERLAAGGAAEGAAAGAVCRRRPSPGPGPRARRAFRRPASSGRLRLRQAGPRVRRTPRGRSPGCRCRRGRRRRSLARPRGEAPSADVVGDQLRLAQHRVTVSRTRARHTSKTSSSVSRLLKTFGGASPPCGAISRSWSGSPGTRPALEPVANWAVLRAPHGAAGRWPASEHAHPCVTLWAKPPVEM